VGHLEGSYRIRGRSSTDEWWLALVLGPGLLGGGLLRFFFGLGVWIAGGWTVACLLVASAGTLWFWSRARAAHLFFVPVYVTVALLVTVLGIVARR